MVVQPYEVGNCLTARMHKGINSTLDEGQTPVISIHPHCIGRAPEAGPQGKEYLLDGSAYCMDSRGQPQAIAQPMAVRRLTPVECERLQGFPDNYTNIKDKCPDGPRYKALGNSWAVPVVRWIGERIAKAA
jgi:DNA (cytosine-5)-methyltransferase 1